MTLSRRQALQAVLAGATVTPIAATAATSASARRLALKLRSHGVLQGVKKLAD
ncbi:hypothetical protein [Roseateles sp. LYH14W]|uniref:Twin-arginine translocation signal domain-containing protein n=1 Tax=Pelomonas parva TaxID=3299032 RepID=A0ABW7FCH7_9BURK